MEWERMKRTGLSGCFFNRFDKKFFKMGVPDFGICLPGKFPVLEVFFFEERPVISEGEGFIFCYEPVDFFAVCNAYPFYFVAVVAAIVKDGDGEAIGHGTLSKIKIISCCKTVFFYQVNKAIPFLFSANRFNPCAPKKSSVRLVIAKIVTVNF
jgi:hypothetical protein